MERVVYLLGAGFSAPLGLPVIADFILKAKDLYFEDPGRRPHFADVFNAIDALATVKSYVSADLFNIEEVFSILDMDGYLKGERLSEPLREFIREVIASYTPPADFGPAAASNWYDMLFGHAELRRHCWFVASLFHLAVSRGPQGFSSQPTTGPAKYDVISLNYDMVLETIANGIVEQRGGPSVVFRRPGVNVDGDAPWLCKLHGSVDAGDIVPPTWRKGGDGTLAAQWEVAHRMLAEANHLRILGFSLPESDSYIKYLFKSAFKHSRHLKTVDVITLDRAGDVERRFKEFFSFNYFRFTNGNVMDYFDGLNGLGDPKFGKKGFVFNWLEKAHREFVVRPAGQLGR